MTQKEALRVIAGKAISDPVFRAKLLDDPESAISEAGFDLTPDQIEALKEMDREQLERGLTDLDERLTMACWGKTQSSVFGCTWH